MALAGDEGDSGSHDDLEEEKTRIRRVVIIFSGATRTMVIAAMATGEEDTKGARRV